jgi:hypothetical protein
MGYAFQKLGAQQSNILREVRYAFDVFQDGIGGSYEASYGDVL